MSGNNKSFAKLRLGIYYLRKSVFRFPLIIRLSSFLSNGYRSKRKNQERRFFPFKVCLISILQKPGNNRKHGGFLFTEIVVAMAILGLLLVGLALSLDGFARFNRYQLVRQQCTAAAQAELDSITATGGPIPDEDFKRLWPKLSVSIAESAGAGQWQGMRLVEVTANGMSFSKEVEVQLARYVALD